MRAYIALSTAILTVFIGFIAGFVLCWYFMVRPLQVSLDARERSLQEWERINRMEREAIATIKTIDTDELRRWVSTLDDQNARYAELQRLLHKQEVAMTAPATTHIIVVGMVVFGAIGFFAWLVRDANADAARTLDNAVAVLPALQESIHLRLKGAKEPAHYDLLPAKSSRPALNATRILGTIVEFSSETGRGYIVADDTGDELSFRKSDLRNECVASVGIRVSFARGTDREGRPFASMVTAADENN